jgi:hypothetical protein
MSANTNNTAAAGPADTASTNAATGNTLARPFTPPLAIDGTQPDSEAVPDAPRRRNAGR